MATSTLQARWPHLFTGKFEVTGNLWGINPGGGRFYAPNRRWISTTRKLDLLKGADIRLVEAHDTDILDLVVGKEKSAHGYPEGYDESDRMDLLNEAVGKFEEALNTRGMACGMFTMNLFNSHYLFNFGNFGSEVEDARRLAIERTIVGMRIAQRLKCIYVYWNGTNGVDGLVGANHAHRFARTYKAIVHILNRLYSEFEDTTQPMAAEAKIEEPKRKMYCGTPASFTSMAYRLAADHPHLAGLLGVNIETGHSIMAKADPAMDVGEALFHNVLYHTHLNDQCGSPGYDVDAPAGSYNPYELFDVVYQLIATGYTGLLGIDVQPLSTDDDDVAVESIKYSADMIRWAVDKVRTADHPLITHMQATHNQAGINRYLHMHLHAD